MSQIEKSIFVLIIFVSYWSYKQKKIFENFKINSFVYQSNCRISITKSGIFFVIFSLINFISLFFLFLNLIMLQNAYINAFKIWYY